MNTSYIKDYKDKELKHFIMASVIVVVSLIGLRMYGIWPQDGLESLLLKAIPIDLLEAAIGILVYIFTELWNNTAKVWIVYKQLPSDTVFSDIIAGKMKSLDFDIVQAKNKYHTNAQKTNRQQTIEWNKMLREARKEEVGSVIEAERSQLLTRDMCITSFTLFIINVIVFIIVAIVLKSFSESVKLFALPMIYLVAMFFITKMIARNKAKRLLELVIKNDLITQEDKEIILPEQAKNM